MKKRRLLLVAILTIVASLAFAGVAFADGESNLHSKKVITKGENIASVPTATFEFVVENGSAGKEISYDATTDSNGQPVEAHTVTTLEGVSGGLTAPTSVTVTAGAETKFNFAIDATKFSNAGTYRYVVYEKTATNDNEYVEVEGFTYDSTKHYVDVYIVNDSTGTALECAGYVVTLADEGYGVSSENIVKEDKKEAGGDGTTPVEGGELIFNNKYMENDEPGGGGDGKLHTLKVTKAISGNQANLNETFPFSFTITGNADTATEKETFTYKVFNKAGSQKSTGTATSGTAVTTVALGNGDYVEVYGLSKSDGFSVSETDLKNYKQTIEAHQNLNVTIANGVASKTQFGEDNVTVNFTNGKSGTVPTGIFINNWPIFLVVASLIGIIAVVAVRRRRTSLDETF